MRKNRMREIAASMEFTCQFAMDDFKAKYTGSILGTLWAFFQPLVTIGIYWFIFQLGFKSQPVKDFPFILWLTSGLLPWFFVSDAINSTTACLVEYSYLVKKVLFNIDILPFAKIISALVVQFFLVLFNIVLFMLYGYFPDFYMLQVIYYLLYALVLVIGIGYITSALYIFLKDLVQIVSIILQIIFWATPIVWDLQIMNVEIQNALKLNPLFYIVQGYRDAFIDKNWFWNNPVGMIYYWGIALILLLIGKYIFKKLKPHFADVL